MAENAGTNAPPQSLESKVERLRQLTTEIDSATFRETKWLRRGYDERDVDDYLDYIVATVNDLIKEIAQMGGSGPVAAKPQARVAPQEPFSIPDKSDANQGPQEVDAGPKASDDSAGSTTQIGSNSGPGTQLAAPPVRAEGDGAGNDEGDQPRRDDSTAKPVKGWGRSVDTPAPSVAPSQEAVASTRPSPNAVNDGPGPQIQASLSVHERVSGGADTEVLARQEVAAVRVDLPMSHVAEASLGVDRHIPEYGRPELSEGSQVDLDWTPMRVRNSGTGRAPTIAPSQDS